MKKVNFKKVLVALFAVFALMLLGVEKAEAQSVTASGLDNSSSIVFLSSSEAQDVLLATVTDLKASIQGQIPGSPAVVPIEKTVLYYWGIYTQLQGGKDVKTSISQGIYALNDTNGYGELPSSELMALRTGAVDLLKQ